MHRWMTFILLLCIDICSATQVAATDNSELKNWFNDPFFQVRSAIKTCPIPLGPLMTEAQRRNEAHYRVERGTSCWLEGKCDKPNAYLYDAPIAAAIGQRFSQSTAFQDASLWITVQRKFVMVQGCTARVSQGEQIEALIKTIPDVDRVILQLVGTPDEAPPYPVAPTESHTPKNPE